MRRLGARSSSCSCWCCCCSCEQQQAGLVEQQAGTCGDDDDDDDVPGGFGLKVRRSSSIRSSSKPEVSSASGTPMFAARMRAAAAHAAPVVGLPAAAAAASAAFSTVRLVDAALLTEEQQQQRFARVLDVMQPAFEQLLVKLDEPQLLVLARMQESDLSALLQQPQAERRLLAFVGQVVRREQQQAANEAAVATGRLRRPVKLHTARQRRPVQLLHTAKLLRLFLRWIRAARGAAFGRSSCCQSMLTRWPLSSLGERVADAMSANGPCLLCQMLSVCVPGSACAVTHAAADVCDAWRAVDHLLAALLSPSSSRFCYCSFFPPGWLSFAAHNPRFASWQAFEAGIAFPDPQPASRQHYTRRRELYQACSALLLAARAADAADAATADDTGLPAGGVLAADQLTHSSATQGVGQHHRNKCGVSS